MTDRRFDRNGYLTQFHGRVKDGKMTVTQRPLMDAYLASLPDGPVTVAIERPYNRRSSEQNAYYWGVVIRCCSLATGHSSKELHDIFRAALLPMRVAEFGGKKVELPAQTHTMSTAEFSAYIDQCRQFAAETVGVPIPDPVYNQPKETQVT